MRGLRQLMAASLFASGCQRHPQGEAPNAGATAMTVPTASTAPASPLGSTLPPGALRREERLTVAERIGRKKSASATLPRAEFEAVERAAQSFFGARETSEVDRSGKRAATLQTEERARLEDAFVTALEHVHDPAFPDVAGDPRAIEAELDSVYLRVVTCPHLAGSEPTIPGGITRNGIRDTERLWISYRDAWIALGTRARPDTSTDLWRSWLTRERTAMLRGLATGC